MRILIKKIRTLMWILVIDIHGMIKSNTSRNETVYVAVHRKLYMVLQNRSLRFFSFRWLTVRLLWDLKHIFHFFGCFVLAFFLLFYTVRGHFNSLFTLSLGKKDDNLSVLEDFSQQKETLWTVKRHSTNTFPLLTAGYLRFWRDWHRSAIVILYASEF